MTEKTENKIVEREYIISLRKKVELVPRYKRTNKAVKTIKEFIAKHMRVENRDLNKVRVDFLLNDYMWSRGIKHPPMKIKVKAIKEGDIVRVTLADLPSKLEKKKNRILKREEKAKSVSTKKIEKETKKKEESEQKKEDIKEKEEASKEAEKEFEKEMSKELKHQTGGKTKEKTTPRRQALQK